MISDHDIYWAALLIVKRYEADAGLRAAERAAQLLARGDIAGAGVWRRVVNAIEELGRGRRGGEATH